MTIVSFMRLLSNHGAPCAGVAAWAGGGTFAPRIDDTLDGV
jgi:hypothetical protein